MKNKKTGISLVALVVTIIVLIILTGTVIMTFMDGGLIDRAREAVFKNDITVYQEKLAILKSEEQIKIATGKQTEGKLNGIDADDIQDFLPEFSDKYNNILAVNDGELVGGIKIDNKENAKYKEWLEELGITENAYSILLKDEIKDIEDKWEQEKDDGTTEKSKEEYVLNEQWGISIGDIVNYTVPSGQSYSGNWRVLGVDNNQVMLISDSIGTLSLTGKQGYSNSIIQLDQMCSPYADGEIGTKARSVRVADINDITGYNPEQTIYRPGTGWEYGNVGTYSIIKDDAGNPHVYYEGSNGVIGDYTTWSSSNDVGKFVSIDGVDLANGGTYKVKSNHYNYGVWFADEKVWTTSIEDVASIRVTLEEMDLIIGNEKTTYWLADQAVLATEWTATWGIRFFAPEGTVKGSVNRDYLYNSGKPEKTLEYAVRAVVYLAPDTEFEKVGESTVSRKISSTVSYSSTVDVLNIK